MEGFSKKIIYATILKEKIENIILRDRKLSRLLGELKDIIQKSRALRDAIGLSGICASCGSKNHDCCGKGIELRYTVELLSLNLFFGINIPAEMRSPNSCYFLSEKGCILFVRDVFCINFICHKAKNVLSFDKLKRLWQVEGLEVERIFEVTEVLKKLSSEPNF